MHLHGMRCRRWAAQRMREIAQAWGSAQGLARDWRGPATGAHAKHAPAAGDWQAALDAAGLAEAAIHSLRCRTFELLALCAPAARRYGQGVGTLFRANLWRQSRLQLRNMPLFVILHVQHTLTAFAVGGSGPGTGRAT